MEWWNLVSISAPLRRGNRPTAKAVWWILVFIPVPSRRGSGAAVNAAWWILFSYVIAIKAREQFGSLFNVLTAAAVLEHDVVLCHRLIAKRRRFHAPCTPPPHFRSGTCVALPNDPPLVTGFEVEFHFQGILPLETKTECLHRSWCMATPRATLRPPRHVRPH